jgi:hypothetical protein
VSYVDLKCNFQPQKIKGKCGKKIEKSNITLDVTSLISSLSFNCQKKIKKQIPPKRKEKKRKEKDLSFFSQYSLNN